MYTEISIVAAAAIAVFLFICFIHRIYQFSCHERVCRYREQTHNTRFFLFRFIFNAQRNIVHIFETKSLKAVRVTINS